MKLNYKTLVLALLSALALSCNANDDIVQTPNGIEGSSWDLTIRGREVSWFNLEVPKK